MDSMGSETAFAGFQGDEFSPLCMKSKQPVINRARSRPRTGCLSNPDERLRWQADTLPADDLCTGNAIMLRRFNRYPLIIDPSGQATEFILNEFKDRKITRTSFLGDAFRMNLDSGLRFDSMQSQCLNSFLKQNGLTLIKRGRISSNYKVFIVTNVQLMYN